MIRPVPLSDALDEREFGGKCASLARAIRCGLPVPPGAALGVSFVEAVIAGEGETIALLEDTVDELGGSVAVRSSAVGEDDQETSFADQHATLLNVRTHAGLIEAIHEVYQSAHSASALAYRERMGISGEPMIGVASRAGSYGSANAVNVDPAAIVTY